MLLLANEQENMVDRYLDKGKMFVLDNNDVKAKCVVTDEGDGILEIKNIAVLSQYQKHSYEKALINLIAERYKNKYLKLRVGTGAVPSTLTFYEKCGFTQSDKIKNFFTDKYGHIIIEDGVPLIDMIYL